MAHNHSQSVVHNLSGSPKRLCVTIGHRPRMAAYIWRAVLAGARRPHPPMCIYRTCFWQRRGCSPPELWYCPRYRDPVAIRLFIGRGVQSQRRWMVRTVRLRQCRSNSYLLRYYADIESQISVRLSRANEQENSLYCNNMSDIYLCVMATIILEELRFGARRPDGHAYKRLTYERAWPPSELKRLARGRSHLRTG